MSGFVSKNYSHIGQRALTQFDLILRDVQHVSNRRMVYLKQMLDSTWVFTEAEQKTIEAGLLTFQFDATDALMARKEKIAAMWLMFMYCLHVVKWCLAVICFVGLSVLTGGHSLILGMPVMLGYGGTVMRWGAWGVLGSFVGGIVIVCLLYRFVFKVAFGALWVIVKPILKVAYDSVAVVLNDVWKMTSSLFKTVVDWFKTLVPAQGSGSKNGECVLPFCDLANAVKAFGGIISLRNLGATIVTVLIALNATHELVDPQGVRVQIVPKDFATLPTVHAQQYRIVRNAPVSEEKIKMDIPKSPFQEKAEFKVEQEKKRPEDISKSPFQGKAEQEKKRLQDTPEDNSWKAFFVSWGVWGVKTMGEHVAVYAVRALARKCFNFFFEGQIANTMPMVKVVVTALAGAVTTQVVDDNSYSVIGLTTGAAMFVTWKVLEYAMQAGFDHIFHAKAIGSAPDQECNPVQGASSALRAATGRVGAVQN